MQTWMEIMSIQCIYDLTTIKLTLKDLLQANHLLELHRIRKQPLN